MGSPPCAIQVGTTNLWNLALYNHGEHPYGLRGPIFLAVGPIADYGYDVMALLSALVIVSTAFLLVLLAWHSGVLTAAPMLPRTPLPIPSVSK